MKNKELVIERTITPEEFVKKHFNYEKIIIDIENAEKELEECIDGDFAPDDINLTILDGNFSYTILNLGGGYIRNNVLLDAAKVLELKYPPKADIDYDEDEFYFQLEDEIDLFLNEVIKILNEEVGLPSFFFHNLNEKHGDYEYDIEYSF